MALSRQNFNHLTQLLSNILEEARVRIFLDTLYVYVYLYVYLQWPPKKLTLGQRKQNRMGELKPVSGVTGANEGFLATFVWVAGGLKVWIDGGLSFKAIYPQIHIPLKL